MIQKIFIANIVLLLVILCLGYLVATTRYVTPLVSSSSSPRNPREGKEGEDASPRETETDYRAPASPKEVSQLVDKYPNFGKAPIFDTIIPKPTQPPRPTPTPAPPPDINAVTARWKLASMFGNTATFRDTASNNEWTMTIGSTHDVQYRNQTCSLKLEKVDENNFEVTISLGDQQKKFSMW
jgi:hypothetical protein